MTEYSESVTFRGSPIFVGFAGLLFNKFKCPEHRQMWLLFLTPPTRVHWK